MYKQYLERLELLSLKDEVDFFKHERRTCFDTAYPFNQNVGWPRRVRARRRE